MKKILLAILSLSLFSCDDTHLLSDSGDPVVGDYEIQHYIINGDTLIDAGRVNKYKGKRLSLFVNRRNADSLIIGLSLYDSTRNSGGMSLRYVGFKDNNGTYRLTSRVLSPQFYEGTISDHVLSERASLGFAFAAFPDNYLPPQVEDPADNIVILKAIKKP